MNNQQRRNFIKMGALVSGSLLSSSFVNNEKKMTKMGDTGHKNLGKRTLGSGIHKIEVSALGLGCMGMSFNRSFIPDRKYMIEVIRKAYELGVTFLILQKYTVPLQMKHLWVKRLNLSGRISHYAASLDLIFRIIK